MIYAIAQRMNSSCSEAAGEGDFFNYFFDAQCLAQLQDDVVPCALDSAKLSAAPETGSGLSKTVRRETRNAIPFA